MARLLLKAWLVMPINARPADLCAAMDRYAKGDNGAFPMIYAEAAPRLLGFLVRETRNQALAEDLVQQTFLQVHRARARYQPDSDVLTWFFAIARRLLIDTWRKGKRHVPLADNADADHAVPLQLVTQPNADERFYSKQLGGLLRESLQTVADDHRTAFELAKLEGLPHAEIAVALKTTCAAVKVRVHRVTRTLQEASFALAG